jgi:hypothetical protein
MIALCRRFASLGRPERHLAVEAAVFIALSSVGLRLIRFLTLRRLLDRCVRLSTRPAAADPRVINAIDWAIRVVAARLPSATCLPQALAADAMLRRRQIASELRFGITANRTADMPISGHAWVECGGGVTIGAAENQPPLAILTSD